MRFIVLFFSAFTSLGKYACNVAVVYKCSRPFVIKLLQWKQFINLIFAVATDSLLKMARKSLFYEYETVDAPRKFSKVHGMITEIKVL